MDDVRLQQPTLQLPILVTTGVAGLDDILTGGLTPNRLYLIEGDPGSGKTTLGLQFLMAGRDKGGKSLYVTLSETRDELLAVGRSHGWSLEGIAITELAPPIEALEPEQENTLFHPSEMELSETTKLVLREIERIQPERIVFDSLSEMRLLAQNPLRYRRQILALKQFFIGRQCTVMLLDDRTAEGSDLQVQSLAHGVVSLERRSPEYGIMQRRLQVQKMRGRDFRVGFHDYVIRRGGVTVFPRLIAAEHVEAYDESHVKSGLAGLDSLMKGGLDRGTSTLLIGPAGTGKSTLATQYVMGAADRGERSAMFIFDESRKTLLQRSSGMGLPLRRHLEGCRVSVTQVDPGSISAGEFVDKVRSEVEERNACMVVIDSLNGYLNAMPEARFLTLHLHELLTYLSHRGVTTILVVAQQGIMGPGMVTNIDISYLADSVIMLRYFEATGQVRQAISVLKKRSGPHERTIREFKFSDKGVEIGEPLSEFHGVLTGVPVYRGADGPLLRAARP